MTLYSDLFGIMALYLGFRVCLSTVGLLRSCCLSLLLILLLTHQSVMWAKLGIYLSFCVFLFLSLALLLFSFSVVSHSLRPHGLPPVRFPCSSPSLEFAQTHVHWVGDAIHPFNGWMSVVPSSSCLQSFPATRSFLMSQLFTSGDQSVGASAKVLIMNI